MEWVGDAVEGESSPDPDPEPEDRVIDEEERKRELASCVKRLVAGGAVLWEGEVVLSGVGMAGCFSDLAKLAQSDIS